jgi:hypothetical protein
MKIELCNGKSIIIPNHLLNQGGSQSGFSENGSWISVLRSKNTAPKFLDLRGVESLRKRSMLELTASIRDQYTSYMEPFGGAGIHAMLLHNDPDQTFVNDFDPECIEILNKNFPSQCVSNYDLMSPDRTTLLSKKPDFLFIDSNNFTLNAMTKPEANLYKDLTLEGFLHAQKFIAINDCSCFYLKYGAKSFKKYSDILGTEIHSLEDYYRALPAYWNQKFPQWHLVRIVHFGVTSYQLFQRDPAPLELIYLTLDILKEKPIIKDIVLNDEADTLDLFGETAL